MYKIIKRPNFRVSYNLFVSRYSSSKETEPEIPTNALKSLITADRQPEKGAIYDKKPFPVVLEANKKYSWCSCGKSHTQPLCDGTHKNQQLKIALKPIKFSVTETKQYWICNCKQTSNRPFCDGTHKSKEIQEATVISKT